jgi:DNA-directed RNA polymerase subunit RPC12/RpoP
VDSPPDPATIRPAPYRWPGVLAALLAALLLTSPAIAQAIRYTCSQCGKHIPHEVGSGKAPRECPHCGAKFDGVQWAGGGPVTERFERPLLSNFAILGILCGLFVLALAGGGVFLIITLVKKNKRKPRRKARIRDEFDDDEDDRPRRRR